MKNTIFDVIDNLRTTLLPTGINIYKDIKPAVETGKCIILTYVPIKKNNVSSINDVIVLLYLPKISGLSDRSSIKTYCLQISSLLKSFVATNGVICFNENSEPVTDNTETNYTVTTYKFRTINS